MNFKHLKEAIEDFEDEAEDLQEDVEELQKKVLFESNSTFLQVLEPVTKSLFLYTIVDYNDKGWWWKAYGRS